MNIKLFHLLIVAVVMTAVHFTAIRLGWYEGRVMVDMPLHFTGGILFGMTWLWAARHLPVGAPSRLLVATSIVSFALLGSFFWELLEFGFWQLFPKIANPLKIYSSTVTDVLSDLGSGVLGGTAVAVIHFLKK